MVFKAIIFDLDNTLTDFMQVKRDCVNAALEAMTKAGLPLTQKKARTLLWKEYYAQGLEDQQIFQKYLEKILGRVDYKILASGVLAYKRAKEGQIKTYPDVLPTLTELKKRGLLLAIVTDAPGVQAWTRLYLLGLENAFNYVQTIEDAGVRKPNPKAFTKALHALKLSPSQVLFVGDSLERDITGAKAVGLKTAWAKYGSPLEEPHATKPDYVLNSFRQLQEIVKT